MQTMVWGETTRGGWAATKVRARPQKLWHRHKSLPQTAGAGRGADNTNTHSDTEIKTKQNRTKNLFSSDLSFLLFLGTFRIYVFKEFCRFSCFQSLLEKVGRLESWKVSRLEGWKVRRLEG